MKAAMLTGLAIMGIATAANAAVIYSNTFEDAPGDTQTQAQVLADTATAITGTVGAAHIVINPATAGDNLTNVFKLSTNSTSGSGSGTGVFTWGLGGTYDLYAGGNGTLTMDIARNSSTPDLKVELLSGGTSETTYTYTFTDYYNNSGGWHTISIPLTSADNSIDSVQFTIRRTSGKSGVGAYIDNVNASVPEPGSAALVGLSVFGLAVIRHRRKATV